MFLTHISLIPDFQYCMHPRLTMAWTCSSPSLVTMAEVGSFENAIKKQARVQSQGSQARPAPDLGLCF